MWRGVAATARSCFKLSQWSALSQLRHFSREPADGTQGRKLMQDRLREHAAEQRLHDGWAWVGALDQQLSKAKRRATKIRRKLQYPNSPEGREKREEQRRYWEEQAQR
eukprot:symbB.v1.2.008411.t1/scaffold528.1/size191705/2